MSAHDEELLAPWANMRDTYAGVGDFTTAPIRQFNDCANHRAEAICARLDRLIALMEENVALAKALGEEESDA